MAKFYGVVGYIKQTETSPGVWENTVTEKDYRGDIMHNNNRWKDADKVNDDIVVDNRISIIADPFALDNFQYIKYIVLYSAKWKIQKIEIQRPRLILTTGELYNG